MNTDRLAINLRAYAHSRGAPEREDDQEVAYEAAGDLIKALRSYPEVCNNCEGAQWVCENHASRPWGGISNNPAACECGAGMPCGACCLEMASAGYVDRREKAIATWLTELKPSYSGWNPHDEQFDSGWNGAIRWVAEQIKGGKHWSEAQAIEARSAETERLGPTDESAVSTGDAP